MSQPHTPPAGIDPTAANPDATAANPDATVANPDATAANPDPAAKSTPADTAGAATARGPENLPQPETEVLPQVAATAKSAAATASDHAQNVRRAARQDLHRETAPTQPLHRLVEQPRPKRRRKTIIALIVIAVLIILATATFVAEAVARTYAHDRVKAELVDAGVNEPQVDIDTGSVIWSYLRDDIKAVNINAPSATLEIDGQAVTLRDITVKTRDLQIGPPAVAGQLEAQGRLDNSQVEKLAAARIPQLNPRFVGDKLEVSGKLGPLEVRAKLDINPVRKDTNWVLRFNPTSIEGALFGYGIGAGEWKNLASFEVDLPAQVRGIEVTDIEQDKNGFIITLQGTAITMQ